MAMIVDASSPGVAIGLAEGAGRALGIGRARQAQWEAAQRQATEQRRFQQQMALAAMANNARVAAANSASASAQAIAERQAETQADQARATRNTERQTRADELSRRRAEANQNQINNTLAARSGGQQVAPAPAQRQPVQQQRAAAPAAAEKPAASVNHKDQIEATKAFLDAVEEYENALANGADERVLAVLRSRIQLGRDMAKATGANISRFDPMKSHHAMPQMTQQPGAPTRPTQAQKMASESAAVAPTVTGTMPRDAVDQKVKLQIAQWAKQQAASVGKGNSPVYIRQLMESAVRDYLATGEVPQSTSSPAPKNPIAPSQPRQQFRG